MFEVIGILLATIAFLSLLVTITFIFMCVIFFTLESATLAVLSLLICVCFWILTEKFSENY
jgi:hypothetical protein